MNDMELHTSVLRSMIFMEPGLAIGLERQQHYISAGLRTNT